MSMESSADSWPETVEAGTIVRLYCGTGHTEDDMRAVLNWWREYLDGATLIPAYDIWKGQQENSVIVEIIGGGVDFHDLVTKLYPVMQEFLREFNEQEIMAAIYTSPVATVKREV